MESILKIILISIFLALINGKSGDHLIQTSSDQKESDKNVIKFDNKSSDLVSSEQHFNYNYVKENPPNDDYYENNRKSYLKEKHYFHDKQAGFERSLDWGPANDEMLSKKIKKDLYNKRNDGRDYDSDVLIEIKKWDDEKPIPYQNSFQSNYQKNKDTNNNYNNFDDKNKIKFYSNLNTNNNQNYKSDGNKDNNNYSNEKYGTDERGRVYSGYDEDNQKWFTNMEDKAQSGSTENEVTNEDNYNNFNSPKFIVNFHNFKPWNQMMRNRRHENTNDYNADKTTDDIEVNFDISSDNQYHNENSEKSEKNEKSAGDDKFNYSPTFLTNLNNRLRDESNDNNNNYIKNKINSNERDVNYEKTDFKEMIKKNKNRNKNMRYHYEKRVEPRAYSNYRHKNHEYGNGYESNGDYPTIKPQVNRKFIEMPYDMLNTGWSSVQKPMRHTFDKKKPIPKVTQYRYGF